jgi:hypothetical protein
VIEFLRRPHRHQLGAEELVELGRAGGVPIPGRMPFLVRRPQMGRAMIGNLTTDAQADVTGSLAFNLNALAGLLNVPLDRLLQGADVTFKGLDGLLHNVPVLGQFLSQTLLLGKVTIQFGLPVPAALASGLPGILGNVSRAMSAAFTASDNQAMEAEARNTIVSQAPEALRSEVQALLDSANRGVPAMPVS